MTNNPATNQLIAVCAESRADQRTCRAATRLADELGLDSVESDDRSHEMILTVTNDRLEVRWDASPGTPGRSRPTFVKLTKIDGQSPTGRSKKQPIARAVGFGDRTKSAPHVLDATAGFGEDAWLLASLGCTVTAVERHPVVAALLADGLRRAGETMPQVAGRIRIVCANAHELMRSGDFDHAPDVVYLDPMFPTKRKSALERKPMRLLRRLVGPDEDAGELVQLARDVAQRRVVVKRPPHGPTLVDEPAAMHKGKSVRYDVYPVR
jgi:16S rRNA (guanine1516-N2)-methyltransferase